MSKFQLPRAWRHRGAALAAAGMVSLLALDASAITFGATAPEVLHDGNPLLGARSDCDAGRGFTWDLIEIANGDVISVWGTTAGNCQDAAERSGANQTCFELRDAITASNTTAELTVSVDELTNAVDAISGCVDSSTGANVSHQVSVYFLVNASSGTVDDANAATVDVTLDFVGPQATTMDTVGPAGSTELAVTWNDITSESNESYRIYCAVADDQATDGECTAADLTPGEVPTGNPCDAGSTTGFEGTAIGLTEATRYAVGVVAQDQFENAGVLSDLVCSVPAPVDGFGDRIGNVDGFCTVGPVGRPADERPSWPLALLGLGAAFALRRRGGSRA